MDTYQIINGVYYEHEIQAVDHVMEISEKPLCLSSSYTLTVHDCCQGLEMEVNDAKHRKPPAIISA
eukprot:15329729-Ditylum_brightwellii.AAC.1